MIMALIVTLHSNAVRLLNTMKQKINVEVMEGVYAIHLSSGQIYAVNRAVAVAISYGQIKQEVCISKRC